MPAPASSPSAKNSVGRARRPLLAQRGGAGGQLLARDTGRRHAGQVALDVGREDRDAVGRQLLREQLQGPGLPRPRGSRDETVTGHHRQRDPHRHRGHGSAVDEDAEVERRPLRRVAPGDLLDLRRVERGGCHRCRARVRGGGRGGRALPGGGHTGARRGGLRLGEVGPGAGQPQLRLGRLRLGAQPRHRGIDLGPAGLAHARQPTTGPPSRRPAVVVAACVGRRPGSAGERRGRPAGGRRPRPPWCRRWCRTASGRAGRCG